MRTWSYTYIYSCDLRQFSDYSVVEHIVLTDDDMKAVNTESDPNRVAPVQSGASRMDNGRFTTVFGKHSWNVVRLKNKIQACPAGGPVRQTEFFLETVFGICYIDDRKYGPVEDQPSTICGSWRLFFSMEKGTLE